jgi:hypothetical protein
LKLLKPSKQSDQILSFWNILPLNFFNISLEIKPFFRIKNKQAKEKHLRDKFENGKNFILCN